MKVTKNIFFYFCQILLKYYCPLNITNKIIKLDFNIKKSFIICANHNSHIDTCVLLVTLNKIFNVSIDNIAMLAADDYFFANNVTFKILQNALNLIPIVRPVETNLNKNNIFSLRDTIKNCKKVIDNKGVIIIYPEGTRSHSNNIQNFKLGAAWFANKLNTNILPVYISGTDKVMPKGKIIPKPYNISISIGDMITNKDISNNNLELVIEKLRKDIINLSKSGETCQVK